jgi:diguanylate cyclase (GGDEF)-like protein
MIYTNIRNFKFINDSLGMGAGDELLRFWAERLLDYLSDEDAVSRIEADHFAILCRMGNDEHVATVEKKVFDPVRNYFASRDKDIRVQICTGVYVLTSADHWHINVDHFLDFARMAEKKVREEHKEGYELYNPKQWVFGKLAADVVSYLPVAIKNGETQVWYQPQVNYETGRIIGAEALCRWDSAKRGWISPAEFIPALEEAGLIYDLDCFVWDTVCRDLRRWNEQGSHRALSVNLSRADFADDRNIPDHFKELIDTYGLTPDQLHVEITETAYVENPELLINTTNKLREYGFRVEMDDFGSGYSSLNMLKEVSVDRIKLDLRFLTETGDPEKGHIIIDHVISMAKALGMDIIAEGVEQEEQARFLKELGCLEMQGFYFHKPMPSKDFEGLFDKEKEDQ